MIPNMRNKKRFYHLLLLTLSFTFSLLEYDKYFFERSEQGLVEKLQSLILLFCITIILLNYKVLAKKINKRIINIKLLILSFVLYEEVSFTTANQFVFLSKINDQSLLNIHNLYFFKNYFELSNQFISISISYFNIVLFTIILIYGFGSYISFFKPIKFLLLSSDFSYISAILFINYLITIILRSFGYLDDQLILHIEFYELILYLTTLFDSIIKLNEVKRNLK